MAHDGTRFRLLNRSCSDRLRSVDTNDKALRANVPPADRPRNAQVPPRDMDWRAGLTCRLLQIWLVGRDRPVGPLGEGNACVPYGENRIPRAQLGRCACAWPSPGVNTLSGLRYLTFPGLTDLYNAALGDSVLFRRR